MCKTHLIFRSKRDLGVMERMDLDWKEDSRQSHWISPELRVEFEQQVGGGETGASWSNGCDVAIIAVNQKQYLW